MLDGISSASGAIDGVGVQVGRQFAEITAISSYSFLVSLALLMIMKYIPGLHLRVSEEAEHHGLDYDQFMDESIGDWNMFDHAAELEALRNTVMIESTPTPPTRKEIKTGEVTALAE